MRPRPRNRHGPAWLAAWLPLAAFVWSAPARSAEVSLELRMIGQAYQTRTVAGELLDQRRITQWVNLEAVDLFDLPRLGLQVDFRFDTDFGQSGDPWASGAKGAELMAALVRYRSVEGLLQVSLGRQLLWDEIDFVQFDGLRLDLRLPWHLGLRLVSGLEVRDRTWLGSAPLELDGVAESFVPAPLLGGSVWFRLAGHALGVDYRRVVLWEEDWPLSSERLAAWAAMRWLSNRLGFDGGASYNLAQDQFQRLRAAVWGRLPWPEDGLRLEAGFLSSRPLFALDSIFAFFSPAPFWQIEVAARQDLAAMSSLRLAGYLRQYRPGVSADTAAAVGARAWGLELDVRAHPARWATTTLFLGYEDGASGRRWLAIPSIRADLPHALDLEGRLLLVSNRDPINSRFDGLTFGGSAGLRWRFGRRQAVILVAEANGNRQQPLQTRVLAVIDLAFQFGPGLQR